MNHPIRIMRSRKALGGLLILGLSVFLIAPVVSYAAEVQLRPYNRGRGLQSPVRTPSERDQSQPTRLSGIFEYSYREGLTLGGRTIQITSRTSVFPSIDGSSILPDPAELQGRSATIYGSPGPNGVEAVLLILDPDSMYGISTENPTIQQFSIDGGELLPQEMSVSTPQ